MPKPQDEITRKVGTGKLLEHRLTLLEDGLLWVNSTSWWELATAFVVTVGVGAQQDASTAIPLVAILDAAMLPTDEVLLGATPVAIVLEVVRRNTRYDPLGWLQKQVAKVPTWVLTTGLTSVVAAITGADIYIGIPGFGAVGLPWQFVDQYLLGLPMLLMARELYLRYKRVDQITAEADAVRLDVPASSTVEK